MSDMPTNPNDRVRLHCLGAPIEEVAPGCSMKFFKPPTLKTQCSVAPLTSKIPPNRQRQPPGPLGKLWRRVLPRIFAAIVPWVLI